MNERLTFKQQRVLDFIKKHIHDSGYPPTVREIAGRLGLAGPNSAKKFLDILERKGWLRRKAGSSRAIELRDAEKKVFTRMVPIVGTVRAGTPVLAVEHIEGRIAVDGALARSDDMFFLRVRGDSMIDAHIMDGDLALIHPQSRVEQGEIAAVLVGDEATIKYFFKEQHAIRLQPANAAMKPLRIAAGGKDTVRIIGKVAGIVRRME